jgi:sugar phosphate isomerase/epimerase
MGTTYDRRDFLEQTAAVAAGIAAAGAASPLGAATAAAPTQPTVARIGLQLYTISDQTARDMDHALEEVAKIGYKFVEFAGYGSRTPEQTRATLDRLRLRAPSTHIALTSLRGDLEGQMHIAETLGHEYITVPSLGGDMPTSADGWKKMADEFNTLGTKTKARRLGLAFHSHRDEFMDLGGGRTGMDVFISGTDPSLVAFEMDLGWARVAGQNPADWFARYPGRIKMWHVKDILALSAQQDHQREVFRELASRGRSGAPGAASGAAPAPAAAPAAPPAVTAGPVPVGAGEIDYKPIFAQWRPSGLEYFFVEQDGAANWPGGSLVAITTSYRNLVNLLS